MSWTAVKEAVAKMPPLAHYRDRSQPWSVEQSDVIDWLIAQPAVKQMVFDVMTIRGLIKFDEETKLWKPAPEGTAGKYVKPEPKVRAKKVKAPKPPKQPRARVGPTLPEYLKAIADCGSEIAARRMLMESFAYRARHVAPVREQAVKEGYVVHEQRLSGSGYYLTDAGRELIGKAVA